MNDISFADKELEYLNNEGLIRHLKVIITASGPWVELEGGKRVLQFASNNYLGLANNPEVVNAAKTSISKYGLGSTGSRLLSGNYDLHVKLEKTLSEFYKSEDCIFFSSGYMTNMGVLSALLTNQDAIYSDELNHASIIDGIKLSRSTKFIYNHNDTDHLERLIKENYNKFQKNIIITDTVFSMDGDVAPLEKIAFIADKYNCIPVVDEAHAIGVFGKTNSGLVEELNLYKYFPIKIGTCSKALGVEGGFCAAPKNIIDYLKQKSRPFMFSTSPCLATVGALLRSLELLKEASWRKEKLWKNAKDLHTGLKKIYKLKISDFKTPNIIVKFRNIQEVLNVSARLFNECHIWAPAIRPPTVKEPRIRLTPIATHSEDDINYVIKAFNYVSNDLKVEPLIVN